VVSVPDSLSKTRRSSGRPQTCWVMASSRTRSAVKVASVCIMRRRLRCQAARRAVASQPRACGCDRRSPSEADPDRLRDTVGSAQSRAVIVETSRRIRCLIQLAQEAGDPELEALMREAMRWVRTNVGNQTVLERLNRWRFAGVDWNMP
jgi:hypothetical protein